MILITLIRLLPLLVSSYDDGHGLVRGDGDPELLSLISYAARSLAPLEAAAAGESDFQSYTMLYSGAEVRNTERKQQRGGEDDGEAEGEEAVCPFLIFYFFLISPVAVCNPPVLAAHLLVTPPYDHTNPHLDD